MLRARVEHDELRLRERRAVNFLRGMTKIAINHFGFDVRRVASPAKLTMAGADADPITFEYIKDRRGYAVLEIPVADLRAFHCLGLPLRPDCHPFVRAIEAALGESNEEQARSVIERVLRDYYRQVQPSNAAEVMGLRLDDLPGIRDFEPNTDDHPVDVNIVPWNGRSPAEVRMGRRRTASFEGLQNGVFARITDGVTSFGPVNEAKVELEVNRLSRLLASVKARGFDRFDPRAPLQVGAFRRGGEYRWVINSGQHRFATAASFGIETLPAMVTEVIRRDDAAYWPQVVSGIFTEAGAKQLFDRIFDGVPSPACASWIEPPLLRAEEIRVARG